MDHRLRPHRGREEGRPHHALSGGEVPEGRSGKFEPVANKCKRIATQGQYDAVLDFIYNCGPKNWESSTLKKYIEGSHKTWEIQEQFLRWVNAGGKKLGGLVSRRIWEAARYNS